MYITVPIRKKRFRKAEKKHQQSIFKQIQYNTLFQKFTQEDQLKRSNGFVAVKQKILKQNQNTLFRKSCTSFRPSSMTSDKIKRQRPSITSVFSSKSKKNHFFKTTADFFDKKNIFSGQQIIEQKAQQFRQSQDKPAQNIIINQYKILETQDKFFQPRNQFLRSSADDGFQQRNVFSQKSKKKITHKRKNVTLLDLKVQSIQQLMKTASKANVQDFKISRQKDQKKIIKNCWKNFYNQMLRLPESTQNDKSLLEQKISKLRRTATSHNLRHKNSVQLQMPDFIRQKKKHFIQNSNQILQKPTKSGIFKYKIDLTTASSKSQPLSPRNSTVINSYPIESQKMSQFYTFVKGGQKNDEFSNKISLAKYRKTKNKYYILKNVQQMIKEDKDYKKISMENVKLLQPGQIMTFIYLNENHYKLMSKKYENLAQLKEIVP